MNAALAMERVHDLKPSLLAAMLDGVPNVAFWTKDAGLCFRAANDSLARICGMGRASSILTRGAGELLSEVSAAFTEARDRDALTKQRAQRNQLEKWEPDGGAATWLLVNRWPLASDSGLILVGIGRILPAKRARPQTYETLAHVIEHIRANVISPLSVQALCRRGGVSRWQLEQDFLEVFGVSPRRFIANARLELAHEMLESGLTIAEVAHACGFADQSAFARRFRAICGVSPSEFRRTLAQ